MIKVQKIPIVFVFYFFIDFLKISIAILLASDPKLSNFCKIIEMIISINDIKWDGGTF